MPKMDVLLADFFFKETSGRKYTNSARLRQNRKTGNYEWEIAARAIPTKVIIEKDFYNFATEKRARTLIGRVITNDRAQRRKKALKRKK